MECKRKTLSNKNLAELENEKMQVIDSIVSEYKEKFSLLNLNLVCKYVYLSSDDKTYQDFDPEKERDYTSEYVCQARVTVEKQPKTDKQETKEIDEETVVENDDDNDSSIQNEAVIDEEDSIDTSNISIDEKEYPNENVLAFTDVMVLRVYKSFFIEYVSVLDNYDDLTKDLEEFYNHFSSNESENK